MEKIWVIAETTKAVIATVAEKVAHLSCLMIVVYLQLAWFSGSFVEREVVSSTDSATSALFPDFGVVFVKGNAVKPSTSALPDSCLADSLAPLFRCLSLATVAEASSSKNFVTTDIPRELFDRTNLFASPTGLFRSVPASFAIALTPFSEFRKLDCWFDLLAAETLERRIASHRELLIPGVGAGP